MQSILVCFHATTFFLELLCTFSILVLNLSFVISQNGFHNGTALFLYISHNGIEIFLDISLLFYFHSTVCFDIHRFSLAWRFYKLSLFGQDLKYTRSHSQWSKTVLYVLTYNFSDADFKDFKKLTESLIITTFCAILKLASGPVNSINNK